MKNLVMGIDEAGRGPIAGPLVVAGVVLDEQSIRELKALGVKDSKELTPSQRMELAERIKHLASHVIVMIIDPNLIDSLNLNTLEYESIVVIITRALTIWGDGIAEIIVDSIGRPGKAEEEILKLLIQLGYKPPRIRVEEKADKRYTVVAAASIIAKTVRDEHISILRRKYGFRGSGYPTDPHTISWIREEYSRNPSSPPPFIRRTWATLKRIAPGWYKEKKVSSTSGGRVKTLLDYLKDSGN